MQTQTGRFTREPQFALEGYFVGYQWPAVLVKRKSDGKIILVSRQKVRVYESIYTSPLSHQTTSSEIDIELSKDDPICHNSDDQISEPKSHLDAVPIRPATDNNMVQSVKSLQNHKHKMIGTSEGKMLDIEESAIYGNVDSEHEGIYLDSVICSDADKIALEIEEVINKGGTMKEALLKAIRKTSLI
jgi:hypothetical protein